MHRGDAALIVATIAILAAAIYVRMFVPIPTLANLIG
jgi:hypothetical protein